MRLHHVGIVVQDLCQYGEAYVSFLGLTAASAIFEDPIQKVRLQFWKDAHGNLVELIEPNGPDSPVQNAVRKGGGLNHLCYQVEDIDQAVQSAIEKGGVAATGIVPAVAFEGRRVAFVFFPKLNLIEFVEASAT
ncbi:MAG: VOC family protein [Bryobacteraceae bacterium]